MKRKITPQIMKHIIAATTVSAAVTAGVAFAVYTYKSEAKFNPADIDRKMNVNQVLFDGNEIKNKSNENNKRKDNSKMLEKDKNSKEQDKPDTKDQADYLFENSVVQKTTLVDLNNSNDDSHKYRTEQSEISNTVTDIQSNPTYILTESKKNADVILGIDGETDTVSEADGTINNNNSVSNSSDKNTTENTTNTNSPTHSTQKPPSTDITDKPDVPSGGGGATPSAPSNPTVPNTTVKPTTPSIPANTAKDPVIEKTDEILDNVGGVTNKPYHEEVFPGAVTDKNGEFKVNISKIGSFGIRSLYLGQKDIDEYTIFNSLETSVIGKDQVIYRWGLADFNKYVCINAVSFDNGETWTDKFPIEIPSDLSSKEMLIKTGYRFSEKSEWTEKIVDYPLENSCLYVLSKKITEENQTINKDDIINYNLHPLEGAKENLLGNVYITAMLGYNNTHELFPGLMENGKIVPWFYETDIGRHILEPADIINVGEDYELGLIQEFVDYDYNVNESAKNYCYLQALIGYNGKTTRSNGYVDMVEVPKYVQAIKIARNNTLNVGTLKIPDTVFYIDNTMENFIVNDAYVVDKDNIKYASTDDGMLTNKDVTEIFGIPYKVEEIKIPKTVKKVNLDVSNNISVIHIEAETPEELPAVNYEKLKNCKIIVKDSVFDYFVENNKNVITSATGNKVMKESDNNESFTYKNGFVIDNNNRLCKILSKDTKIISLISDIEVVKKGVFDDVKSVTAVIMPKDNSLIKFEKGCFETGSVSKIICYTEEQLADVKKQLEEMDIYSVKAELAQTSADGYCYIATESENQKRYTIINAPLNVTEYDGTVTDKAGNPIEINEIGDNAFYGCERLKYIELPECTDTIGYQAFFGCKELEGVFIGTTDTITIGDKSFDDCPSLRFVGSNAMLGILKNNYEIPMGEIYGDTQYSNFKYAPTDCLGYNEDWTSFTKESGISKYSCLDIGGCKFLYGDNEEGEHILLLRSGTEMPEKVNLPETTIQIFDCAMSNTVSSSGKYAVNFENLKDLLQINGYVFYNSQVGDNLKFNSNAITFDSYAFYSCKNIENFDAGMVYNSDYGRDVFGECINLKTADLGEPSYNSQLYAGLFNYCDNLTDLTIRGYLVPNIIIDGNLGFRFNYELSQEDEFDRLRIHVDPDREGAYISKWCYGYMGYIDGIRRGSAYLNLWDDKQIENMNYNEETKEWVYPSDEEIDRIVKETVLDKENSMRKMFGADIVDEPSNYYPYRVSDDGYITLIGVPSNIDYITLDENIDDLGLPSGWCFDYIGKRAFSGAKSLKDLYLLNCIKGIYSNAFEGFEGEYINIYLSGDEIPELLVDSCGEKFSFGCDESKIHFNAGREWSIYKAEDYIAKWIYSFDGYEDYEQMRSSLKDEITDKKGTTEPTDEEINAEIRKILIPYENRLRMMFGIDTVTEDDETSVVNIIIANNGEYDFGTDFNITEPDFDFSDVPKTEPMPDMTENTDTNKGETTENTDTDKGETTENTDTDKGGTTESTDTNKGGTTENTDTDKSETTESTDTNKGGTTENTDTDKDETTDNTYTESNGVSEDSNDENTNSGLSDSGESGEREETNQ